MKKYTGQTFSDLKLQYQLEHAETLLLNTRMSVNEIADQVGFSCANYFIRRFKSVYHVTPHVFRNSQQEKQWSVAAFVGRKRLRRAEKICKKFFRCYCK